MCWAKEWNLVFLSFSALECRHTFTAVQPGRAGNVTAALCQHNVRHSRLMLHSQPHKARLLMRQSGHGELLSMIMMNLWPDYIFFVSKGEYSLTCCTNRRRLYKETLFKVTHLSENKSCGAPLDSEAFQNVLHKTANKKTQRHDWQHKKIRIKYI